MLALRPTLRPLLHTSLNRIAMRHMSGFNFDNTPGNVSVLANSYTASPISPGNTTHKKQQYTYVNNILTQNMYRQHHFKYANQYDYS